jgi:hypothetical protein
MEQGWWIIISVMPIMIFGLLIIQAKKEAAREASEQ